MDRHSIKSLRYFAIFIIIANIIGNILFLLKVKGYKFSFLGNVDIYLITRFSLFCLIAVFLGVVLNKSDKLKEDEKRRLQSKLRPVLYFNIIFVMYCLITLFVFKVRVLFVSSIIMELAYIAIIIYSKRLYISLMADEHKLKWQKAMLGADSNIEDSNIFWRLKIWFLPFERVPFNKRKFEGVSILYIIAYVYACYTLSFKSPVIWILTIFILKSIIGIIEYILGLYTSLVGICTGIDEASGGSRDKVHWIVYVTDYVHKREIVYKTYDKPYFKKDDKVKIIHSIFLKYVIKGSLIRDMFL